jgi:DNA replication protein DnaC
VFIGETGVGKTGLMISLARKAVQNGYRALFIKAQDLLDEMYASLADRSTRRLLKSLANVDVLAIDELGYVNIKPEQTNIFFKLMEAASSQANSDYNKSAVCDLARLPRQPGTDEGSVESPP